MKKLLAMTLLCALTSSCTGSAGEPRSASLAGHSAARSDMDRTAAAVLYRAQSAYEDGDRAALSLALSRLDAVGLHPVGEEANDVFARWRAAADQPAITRGRILGPGFMVGELAPKEERALEQTFLSGRGAAISLSALEGRPLEISVRDSSDQSLCSKVAERVTCRWVPLYTHRHTITLRNPNTKKTRYQLVID